MLWLHREGEPRGEWPRAQWGTPLSRSSISGKTPVSTLPASASLDSQTASSLPVRHPNPPIPFISLCKLQAQLCPQTLLSHTTSVELWNTGSTCTDQTKIADQKSGPRKQTKRNSSSSLSHRMQQYRADQNSSQRHRQLQRLDQKAKDTAGRNWRKVWVGARKTKWHVFTSLISEHEMLHKG